MNETTVKAVSVRYDRLLKYTVYNAPDQDPWTPVGQTS